jgi:hypothetical protein
MPPTLLRYALRTGATSLLAAGTLLAVPQNAHAIDVFQEFFLSLDVSGSIDTSEFTLYKNGYVSAFNNPTVKSQIQSTYAGGGIAIAVGQWSSSAFSPLAIGWTQINTDAAYTAFVNTLANMPRQGAGGTSVGTGMQAAINEILNNNFTATGANRRVIDVSTDGATSNIQLAVQQRDRAEANEIIINGLGVGAGAATTLNSSVITRATATTKAGFLEIANNFDDFEQAVTAKILREAGQPIPNPTSVPGPVPIFGAAAAFGFSRRLKKRIASAQAT